MDLDSMHALLDDHCADVRREGGAWELTHQNVGMAVITDKRHDRMRIIAPVVPAPSLTDEHKSALLVANFHTALDARYAVSDGTLFAAFIHPLESLRPDLFVSALQQVASLVVTFGVTYSSGELSYGGRRLPKPPNN